MKNERTIKAILYILLIIALILIAGHIEYLSYQEEKRAEELYRIQDTEENYYYGLY